ncbi:NAD(P)-dependent oxidoreductase [Dysosmobacter sp.]|uniref:NAD(P)-dependent oxidoreductase n=1 Tax=Dysosmobacter sp. TaxID=2591382 RepID=UPI002A9A47BD|nr:NAD(P)-dependent oxidoreductase [Dysosmobacter sp.]MDY5611778.1 NAD(P)-dependent oxidoreductase [Dysosmobacter sp.]
MSMCVLVTDGMDAGAIETLRRDGHEIVEQFYEPDQLGEALRDFDAVIIRSATKIKEPQIDAAKGSRLKLIVRAGVGVDNIAVKYAEAAGITVKNTPRASSNAVAELAIALLFSCARNISIAGHTMREKKWEKKAYSKGFEVMGKTMGVIGYGRIGRMVGDKAQALGMKVLSVVHRNKPEGCECDTMHFVSMDELLAQSDIIVLCAPGGDKPLVDAESIAKMKDGVVIVNVSRGSNVDETALLEALNSGKVKAAGLDVWLSEKNPNWELASHPAVSCMPHVGAGTKEAQKRIGAELVDIIEHF